MSSQKVIEKLREASLNELEDRILKSSIFTLIEKEELVKKKKSNLILSSLIASFVKMALIDRDYDDLEEAELIKRLKRFINADTITLFRITKSVKEIINRDRNNSELIYAFVTYLAKSADQNTAHKIFNSFTQIAQADNELSDQEKFLIKNYALIFGMSEKETFGEILKASLLTQSHPQTEQDIGDQKEEGPIIKFDY